MIYLELFWTFFLIGAFTFGGGYAMLPLIQSAVEEKGWIGGEELINFVAVSESTPGPFAINISTYVGAEVGGIAGSACASLGVALPSILVILIVARFYEKFKESFVIQGCMSGLKPAVVGMIGAAVISIGQTIFFPVGLSTTRITEPSFFVSVGIFLLMLLLAFKKIHPILIIVGSAILGILAGYMLL